MRYKCAVAVSFGTMSVCRSGYALCEHLRSCVSLSRVLLVYLTFDLVAIFRSRMRASVRFAELQLWGRADQVFGSTSRKGAF